METTLVMATYNGEKYIEEQLNSILNQSQLPDEVIIIDDKSSDHTVGLVENFIQSYGLAHWELRVNQENLGFKENFRYALSLATKELVFLCDQDDIWECDKIKSMVEVIDGNEEIKLLASSFTFMDRKGEKFEIETDKSRSNNNLLNMYVGEGECIEVDFKLIIKENFAQGCCMCVTKELIEDYLQMESESLPHDWLLVLLAASENKCYYYNEPLIRYRIHDSNAIGLGACITGEGLQSREYRVNNRVQVLREEAEMLRVLIPYNKINNMNKVEVIEQWDCLQERVEYIHGSKILRLIKLYIKNRQKKIYGFNGFGGDIVAILKRNDK